MANTEISLQTLVAQALLDMGLWTWDVALPIANEIPITEPERPDRQHEANGEIRLSGPGIIGLRSLPEEEQIAAINFLLERASTIQGEEPYISTVTHPSISSHLVMGVYPGRNAIYLLSMI